MNPPLPSSPSTVPKLSHLRLCTGTISPLNGRGLVLSPERFRGPLSNSFSPLDTFDTLDPAQRLTCGGVLPKLERVGWVLPLDRGPHMLAECARGIEGPESEPEPATEATTTLGGGSGSEENGADSNHTSYAETTAEVSALGAFNLPLVPAFVFNPDLLHTAKPVSLARPMPSLSVASTPLLRTPARTPIPPTPTSLVPVSSRNPRIRIRL